MQWVHPISTPPHPLPRQVSSCLWESGADGSVVVKWQSDTITALVTVYGVRMPDAPGGM